MLQQYELRRVVSAADAEAYHRIRRTILFEARGRVGIYNENGPDERQPNNQSLILLCEGNYIGTVRLDCASPDLGIIRLFALDAPYQRTGHGARFLALLTDHAARLGLKIFEVNSAPEAVGFWRRQGFQVVDGGREFPLLKRDVLTVDSGTSLGI